MKWYAPLGVIYILILFFFIFGYTKELQFNYPSSSFYEVFGLDSSHHQGEIKWSSINLEKFKFIYLKATEGEDFKDKKFLENYKEASDLDIIVGGYHFWSFCKTPEQQFKNIIATIPKKTGDLIPALDIESSYGCGVEINDIKVEKVINKINQMILSYYGKLPVIYTTSEFASAYPSVLKAPNQYWLRSLVGPPRYKSDWAIWQYYHAGKAKGISGPVDLNVVRKKSVFNSLLQ